MREMDLILGRFADAQIALLDDAELDELDQLLDEQDSDLLNWLTNQQALPADIDTPFFRKIAAFAGATIR
ncbi:antitoxin CptB [Kaistia dalseonensis]|uniref:FAD assembly factor SdhE n=2 Tax=Kaistia dalseonensis TaxID=410840 RepID=A0ABU0H465_9HYPH|nr:antitoxin CptB [Kaistia dalseonensis]